MRKLFLVVSISAFFSCKKEEVIIPLENTVNEDLASYQEAICGKQWNDQ